jgi:teichuronic acid biosynthesis glycosyltransferase TuaC
MHICIITSHYPSENDPTFAFVESLVLGMVDSGNDCTVIAPQSLLSAIKNRRIIRKKVEIRKTKCGNKYTVYSPRLISLSNISILNSVLMEFMDKAFYNKVKRIIESLETKPNVLYGHFIDPAGMVAAKLGRHYNIPSFVAVGESNINTTIEKISRSKGENDLNALSGVVTVSTQLKNELRSSNIFKKIPVIVAPNAIDNSLFYPRKESERIRKRKELGISDDEFVVAFVGYFNERKGPHRLLEAIKGLEKVKGIFLGSGPVIPAGEQVAFCGTIDHQILPEYLCAADIFVLPTLAEGCNNAIIEAMACGLPVVSSNMAFNDDILGEDNSLRINPQNIDEITQAVRLLKNDKILLNKLAAGAVMRAQKLNIESRAKYILQFMKEKSQAL